MPTAKPLSEIVERPYDYARQWKADHHRPVIGYFCSYGPEEIIQAAGALPFRMFGTGQAVSRADAHLQAYSCSLVRGALEDALAGRLDFLDGVVFPHTCDSIQRLSDIWRMNIKSMFHLDLVLPVKLDGDAARNYMVAVLDEFRGNLAAQIGQPITDDQLRQATLTFNAIRQDFQRLYQLRLERPGLVAGHDLHTLVKAAMIIDRDQLAQNLPETITEYSSQAAPESEPKRIVLAGGLCDLPDIHDWIESQGGYVVADDLCTGNRYAQGLIDVEKPPIEALAERYLARAVCPAKHAGPQARGQGLIELAREAKADGVIFFQLKFCDPHAFDYPYLKTVLDQAGIPSVLIELEDQGAGREQIVTRLQAFIEML